MGSSSCCLSDRRCCFGMLRGSSLRPAQDRRVDPQRRPARTLPSFETLDTFDALLGPVTNAKRHISYPVTLISSCDNLAVDSSLFATYRVSLSGSPLLLGVSQQGTRCE